MDRNELKKLFRETASGNEQKFKEFCAALQLPILQEVKLESIVRQLFSVDELEPGTQPIYPIADDFDMSVWILPGVGAVAHQFIEGAGEDVYVPTFTIDTSAEWKITYARDSRVDIVERAINKAAQKIAEYEEESGWRTLLPAGCSNFAATGLLKARSAAIYEVPAADHGAGYFSLELLNRMIVGMQRNDRTLGVLYVSPEDAADIREWTDTEIDPVTRREIFQAAGMGRIWNVELRVINHLGATGKFNINDSTSSYGIFKDTAGSFYDYTVDNGNIVSADGAVTTAGETQVWGFDLSTNDSLVMPVAKAFEPIDDPTLLRKQRQGFFGWEEVGFACLDSRMLSMGVIDRSL